ncbi:cytochrome b5-like [Papilio machaon]|uniref:cytochrome b5-like n=1 Tax=Papilio machaon TaxID=76193 RepID=UPI001E6650BF|nr:cytochrome b5-like [Papilio machaon]
MVKEISSDEVKKHHDKRSAWIIIHNDVYDVTNFMSEHPGGEESLLEFAGKDGTTGFEDVGHSQDAREMLVKYKIGTLPACEITKKVHSCASCSKLKWAIIALAGAIVIGFALKKYLS